MSVTIRFYEAVVHFLRTLGYFGVPYVSRRKTRGMDSRWNPKLGVLGFRRLTTRLGADRVFPLFLLLFSRSTPQGERNLPP